MPRALKTHCKQGHPLSGENLRITSSGVRQCLECVRARGRQSWHKNHKKWNTDQRRREKRRAQGKEARPLPRHKTKLHARTLWDFEIVDESGCVVSIGCDYSSQEEARQAAKNEKIRLASEDGAI